MTSFHPSLPTGYWLGNSHKFKHNSSPLEEMLEKQIPVEIKVLL